jgi:hypothetical protein
LNSNQNDERRGETGDGTRVRPKTPNNDESGEMVRGASSIPQPNETEKTNNFQQNSRENGHSTSSELENNDAKCENHRRMNRILLESGHLIQVKKHSKCNFESVLFNGYKTKEHK